MTIEQTWTEAHPTWVASYMSRDAAERNAESIGGYYTHSPTGGINTWQVFRGPRAIHACAGD